MLSKWMGSSGVIRQNGIFIDRPPRDISLFCEAGDEALFHLALCLLYVKDQIFMRCSVLRILDAASLQRVFPKTILPEDSV
jgi:hypothetical protein